MNICMITAKLVQTMIRKRRREIHKGDCGRILMVAGSEGMMGAAVLSARAALRSGSGLVQLAVPKELFPVAQVAVPEATCRTRSFSAGDLARYDAVAVGPGLGTEEESVEAVRNILELYEGNLVLDADALNIIAKPEYRLLPLLHTRAGQTVITPHIGEAQRLLAPAQGSGTGRDTRTGQATGLDAAAGAKYFDGSAEGRRAMADALVELTKATVVLKGMESLVATAGEKTYINTTGNPGMATGGSGDVLTGIIAGLWGQKQPETAETERCENHGGMDAGGNFRRLAAHEAAVCGVYLHGLAGDLAAEELGEYGLIAGDIAEKIPFAVKKVLEG